MHMVDLRLVTNDLAGQQRFYTQVIGFPVDTTTPHGLALQVGASRLTFEPAPAQWHGCYHFAFNIPENQFADAKAWLAHRVPLLADGTGAQEFYSENWDAHMLYFCDSVGNIVELIARHTLDNARDAPFSSHSIQAISEIGIAAADVLEQVAAIQTRVTAPVYRGPGSATFTTIGDEHGLFVVVQRGRIWFPDTGKPAEPVPITVVVAAHAQEEVRLHFP